MGSVYQQDGKWYLRFKNSEGRWAGKSTKARTKTEAKSLLTEVERELERERMGLELKRGSAGTFREMMQWWLDNYSVTTESHSRNLCVVNRHVMKSELADSDATEVTSGRIEMFLKRKEKELSAQSINHIRQFIIRAYNSAKAAGRFAGENPAKAVKKRKVRKRMPDYLTVEEVPRVIAALRSQDRALFATAIYTGMRKGELFGLKKSSVDFAAGLLKVANSHDRDTTKGGHEDVIPIATQLAPYLKDAFAASNSDLVFPNPEGGHRREDMDLANMLRGALGRAGIVQHYKHVCRRAGCDSEVVAMDNEIRRCEKCTMKLWPKAVVRKIRFHDLRHTTASLLMMAGVSPAAVQKILRHRDPRMTTEVYGHLAPDYLKNEINRLQFDVPAALQIASEKKSFATYLQRSSKITFGVAQIAIESFNESSGIEWRAMLESNQRPSASETNALSS